MLLKTQNEIDWRGMSLSRFYFLCIVTLALLMFPLYQSCQRAEDLLFIGTYTEAAHSGGNGQGYEGKLKVKTISLGELIPEIPDSDFYRIKSDITCGKGTASHAGHLRIAGGSGLFQSDSCSTWQKVDSTWDYAAFNLDFLTFRQRIYQRYSTLPVLAQVSTDNFQICRKRINSLEGIDIILARNTTTVGTSSRNLLSNTENFDLTPWTFRHVVRDVVPGPNGVWTADKLHEFPPSSESTSHGLGYVIPFQDNENYTFSVYAKAGERVRLKLRSHLASGQNLETYFDLENGVIGEIGHQSAKIEPAGEGWFRLQVSFVAVPGSDPTTFLGILMLANSDSSTYVGDGVSGLFLWGAQLELGSAATVYERVQAADSLGGPILARVLYSAMGENSRLLRRGSESVNLVFDPLINRYESATQQFLLFETKGSQKELRVNMDGSNQTHVLDCLSE
jgi:hypothetical protein